MNTGGFYYGNFIIYLFYHLFIIAKKMFNQRFIKLKQGKDKVYKISLALIYLQSQITYIVYDINSKFINQSSTPCQILIKEGHLNLSTKLNLKWPMAAPYECTQTRKYGINIEKHDFVWSYGDKNE